MSRPTAPSQSLDELALDRGGVTERFTSQPGS